MFARTENRQTSVNAGNCGTTAARFAFVARRRNVAEVHAACALQQVTGCGRHVAKLGRRATEDRFGKNRVVFANDRMIREIRIADHRTNR